MVVFFVEFEMVGQLGNALGQDRDLDFGTTRITLSGREFFDDFTFGVSFQHILLGLYRANHDLTMGIFIFWRETHWCGGPWVGASQERRLQESF